MKYIPAEPGSPFAFAWRACWMEHTGCRSCIDPVVLLTRVIAHIPHHDLMLDSEEVHEGLLWEAHDEDPARFHWGRRYDSRAEDSLAAGARQDEQTGVASEAVVAAVVHESCSRSVEGVELDDVVEIRWVIGSSPGCRRND